MTGYEKLPGERMIRERAVTTTGHGSVTVEMTPVSESRVDEIFREMMAPLSRQPKDAVIRAAYGIAKYRARREVRCLD